MMNASPTARPSGRLSRMWQRLVLPTTPTAPGTSAASSVRATIVVAAIPSAASLVWTAWSLIDMIPAPLPVGLAAGVVLDLALVSAVAIAWIAPAVAKPAKVTGWLIASVAAVLVGWHAAQIMPILGVLGLIPLVAKGLWHLALNARLARAAAEVAQAEAARVAEEQKAKRDTELSTELTFEQRKEIADRQRLADYQKQLGAADREVAGAEADTEHQAKLADIRRLGEQRRAMEEEAAKVELARQELIQKINAARPATFAISSGDVPNDLSELPDSSGSLMGFGSVMGSQPRPVKRRRLEVTADLEAKARQVYSPGMPLSAFRQAMGVGMKKAHPLHQMLRAENEGTG